MEEKYNKQEPPVSEYHILAAGLLLFIDNPNPLRNWYREGLNVYDKDDNFICAFDDVMWGFGASGMLCFNNVPIHDFPIQISKVEEIRSARRNNIEDVALHHATAKGCNACGT